MRRLLPPALRWLASTWLALGPRSAHADDASDAREPVALTVTGSAAPGFSSRPKEDARPRDVPDAAALLEGLPGLRVRRLAGDGSFATLSIRGAASNQVGVVLGGVPLTGAADPSLDWATLPLWPGASARVHRTFAPAHVGGGYLGGIVEIAPLDGAASGPRTELYDALGSFGAYRMRVADTRRVGVFQIATGLSFSRHDGDFTFYDPFRGRDVVRNNARAAQAAALVHARGELGRWTLLSTGLCSLREDGVAGRFEYPLLGTRLARDRQILSLEGRRPDDAGRLLARVWARRDGRRFAATTLEGGILPGVTRTEVVGLGGTVARSLRAHDEAGPTFDARLEPTFEAARGDARLGATPTYTRSALAAALDASQRLRPDWSWVLAARADARIDEGPGATRRELLPVAHAGLEWRATTTFAVATHGGVLARPPSFLELLGDGGVYRPAPDLRSERAYAVDVGLRARGGTSVRWELELVGFAWQVKELIVLRPVGLATFRAENVGAARVVGAEASAALAAGPLRAIASYTHLSTEDRTASAVSRGAPLPGRPAHDLTLDVSARVGVVTVRYGFDLVSSTTLDRAGLQRLPTRAAHGLGVRVTLGAWTLLAELANALDQRTVALPFESGAAARPYPISDFQGYPLPGRRWSIAVRGRL